MKHEEIISEKKMDEQLNNFFAMAGKEHAPAGFTQNIMREIERNDTLATIYKPVISKTAWVVIGAGFVAIMLMAVFVFPNTGSATGVWQKLTGIFSFRLSDGNLFHLRHNLLHFLSGSQVLLSVLSVAVVVGWRYLLMQTWDITFLKSKIIRD